MHLNFSYTGPACLDPVVKYVDYISVRDPSFKGVEPISLHVIVGLSEVKETLMLTGLSSKKPFTLNLMFQITHTVEQVSQGFPTSKPLSSNDKSPHI